MSNEIKFDYDKRGYATHQPLLKEVIENSNGNIIELGCGHFSTNFIKSIISNTNIKLYSLESDLTWLKKFKSLEDENHKLLHVPATTQNIPEAGQQWIDFIEKNLADIDFEVCFIDQSPWLATSKKH